MNMHKVIDINWGEDYNVHWGQVSYQDKIVLDLGADLGSTASFFFEKGAKKVIAVESENVHWVKLIENYGNDPGVVCIKDYINSAKQIEDLILKYNPDIVKVDIEDKEEHMGKMEDWITSLVPDYLIETHGKKCFHIVRRYFTKIGYTVKIYAMTLPGDIILIIHAQRK